MKCPKCNGESITAMVASRGGVSFDVTKYRMGCKDCGHSWSIKIGMRRKRTEEEMDEWSNVERILSPRDKKRMKSLKEMKSKRGSDVCKTKILSD